MGQKREGSTEDDEGFKAKHKKPYAACQPRRRPISCKLCRHEAAPNAADLAHNGEAGDSVANEVSTTDILSRLEKLEALISSQVQRSNASESIPQAEPEPQPQLQLQQSLQPLYNQLGYRLQRLTTDALWIERSCVNQKLLDDLTADPMVFRSCPIRLISQPSSFIPMAVDSASSLSTGKVFKCIWLPRRDEAHILLQKYINDINHLFNFLHAPSLIKFMDGAVYDAVDQGTPVHLGGLVLLLSIFACAMFAWTPKDDARCLFVSVSEAHAQTNKWFKAALDVMGYVQRTAHISFECLQGLNVGFFAITTIEGISWRARAVHSHALAMARELGLHSIDHPRNRPQSDNTVCIKTEYERRLWAYLASNDWLIPQFTVPMDGMCFINPRHTFVRKPLHVNNDDLIDGKEVVERPLDELTSSTYLLQRLRLGQIFYDLMDKDHNAPSSGTMNYQRVKDADANLQRYIRELPSSLQIDGPDLIALHPSDPLSFRVTIQRCSIHLLLQPQLCKLHLPYLVRGTLDPTYADSRTECLKAARHLVHLAHQLRDLESKSISTRYAMSLMGRNIFISCIALILDACLEGENGQCGATGTQEIVDVWKTLNDARDCSVLVPKLLDLSFQVLQRHKPKHPALKAFKLLPLDKLGLMEEEPPLTPDLGRGRRSTGSISLQASSVSDSLDMDPAWQDLQGGMNLEAIDWDRLLGAVDASFLQAPGAG
ncbi:hypothetical protein CDD82_2441 [Ophiocordyceps australis]|uniref:Transcription factor domain-containing protein n=1 Tax=Ophiocordyceps australis TaxID=1399860 RepID=A0A2C5XUH8_9HYPO|nr:hypothetical protein CDD82_2441 [Ophiocordyceps australis]